MARYFACSKEVNMIVYEIDCCIFSEEEILKMYRKSDNIIILKYDGESDKNINYFAVKNNKIIEKDSKK